MPEPRRCTGTTKAGGPCEAHPLKGKDVCIGHADRETQASVGFGGPQPGGGRPRNPRPSEIARQLIEQNELALQRPYWRTLGFDVVIGANGPELVELEDGGAKLYGTSKDGDVRVSGHEDLEAMQRAAERLQDRVYGRPKQTNELVGAGGGPIELVPVQRDRGAEVVSLLGRTRALPEGS